PQPVPENKQPEKKPEEAVVVPPGAAASADPLRAVELPVVAAKPGVMLSAQYLTIIATSEISGEGSSLPEPDASRSTPGSRPRRTGEESGQAPPPNATPPGEPGRKRRVTRPF